MILLRLGAVPWGLPASDGWDNDGVAPRDFLPGLLQTFTPGEYYTYPPLHALLLTLVSLPVLIVGALTAPSFAPLALRDHFLHPALMTPIAVLARLVSVAFACAIMHAICCLADELFGGESREHSLRVRRWTAAALLCNVSLGYYSATSNLDVPSLAWTCLAMLALTRMLKAQAPTSLWPFVAFTAFAICTKDQAYASFALSVPIVLLAKIASTATPLRRAWLLQGLKAGASIVILVLCIDGAIFNPRGFLARLRFLTGPASKEHGYYAKTLAGTYWCLHDVAANWRNYYPYALAPLLLVGLVLLAGRARKDRASLALAYLPLLAALSFTLAFNLPAGRTEQRFVLPQSVFLTVYLGIAMAWLSQKAIARYTLFAGLAYAAWGVVGLLASLWNDPRYAAEAWMRAHFAPGSSVETYGESVYLPRFRSDIALQRVAPTPSTRRNPVAHAVELQANISEALMRQPEFIVLTQVWAARYLGEAPPNKRVWDLPRTNPSHYNAVFEDTATRAFVTALERGTAQYARVAAFDDEPRLWPKLQMHASTSCDCGIWIYQRKDTIK